jgi:uncharacterized protein
MTNQRKLILLGWVTLLIFPIPAFVIRFWFYEETPFYLLNFDHFTAKPIVFGVSFGLLCAFLISWISEREMVKDHFKDQKEQLLEFDLQWFQYLFLSICAGIGEELLFRLGVQPFLGIWPTAVLFIAIHGYFSIKNFDDNLPGVLLMPFIVCIAIGYVHFGIWFCVFAHISYDFLVFHLLFSKHKK